MKGFMPGLLDRLMRARAEGAAPAPPGAPVSIEQIKDGVARDLEALLNTRIAVDAATFDDYPAVRGSILRYGVIDFAGLCLTSAADRAAVCASIEDAIATHEPRLRAVTATLEHGAGDVNRLHIAIQARLALDSLQEPVSFNAVLQPSSLHYEIRKSTRTPRG